MKLAFGQARRIDVVLEEESRLALGVELPQTKEGSWSQAQLHRFSDGFFVEMIRLSERQLEHERATSNVLRSVDDGRTWANVAATDFPWLEESTPLESLSASDDGSLALSVYTPPLAHWGSLDVVLDGGTRTRIGAGVLAFARRTEDYSGIRAEWGDVTLHREGGVLVLRIARVVDWQGGIGRDDVHVFESVDGGRSWTLASLDATRRAAIDATPPTVRHSSFRRFV